MKAPKNFEQYIVKRLNELEYENEQLRSSKRWANEKNENALRKIEHLTRDLKYLLSLHTSTSYEKDGKTEYYIDGKAIFQSSREDEYNKLKQLIEYYNAPELPF